ncbi:DUF226 domain-containing protein [Borrelia persica]|uniref:DUF226 domain-containing protein n=1 Tax=Borrelia persica TaxID=44448 RepID=UPI0004653E5B|nr:DUF226 domain-containing protein [Borrelia persica]
MESVLERLKEKKVEIAPKEKNRNLFIKIEDKNNRKIYHTKIMTNFCTFGVDRRQKHRFFIAFKNLLNQKKIEFFSLFALRDDDKFLGIFYGYRKPIKNVIRRYEENGVIKSSMFSKVYYIEFRFKKGSVFCYLVGISYLLRKEKSHKKYYDALMQVFSDLEKQVYEFYNKKLPNGGIITRWVEKNQK